MCIGCLRERGAGARIGGWVVSGGDEGANRRLLSRLHLASVIKKREDTIFSSFCFRFRYKFWVEGATVEFGYTLLISSPSLDTHAIERQCRRACGRACGGQKSIVHPWHSNRMLLVSPRIEAPPQPRSLCSACSDWCPVEMHRR